MSWRSKVIWSQGMFLQPHHFQQEARYFERMLDERARCVTPFAWGFRELVLDDASLALGRLAITRASGVFPDGTPFSIPQLDVAPAPLDATPDMKGERVCLVLPWQREGLAEMTFGDGAVAEMSRFRAAEESVRDSSAAGDEPQEIQTGRLNLSLLREKAATDAYQRLGVARIADRRSDGMVTLDLDYVAPQVACDATGQLSAEIGLIHGLVRHRAEQLVAGMGQLTLGISDASQFLMLQMLNRNEPVLRQIAREPHVHPRALFDHCLQLGGEFATFATSERRPPEFPEYCHDDLGGCFKPVFEALRLMLAFKHEESVIQIPLVERKHQLRTAVVHDLDLVRNADFVLAVNAQMAGDQLRQRFIAQSRVAPPERIVALINGNLPGIPLRQLPVAPPRLPFHAGFHYFQIERDLELWPQFERTGHLAVHVAGSFPGIELELWALRRDIAR